jgi:hypothetical protein
VKVYWREEDGGDAARVEQRLPQGVLRDELQRAEYPIRREEPDGERDGRRTRGESMKEAIYMEVLQRWWRRRSQARRSV